MDPSKTFLQFINDSSEQKILEDIFGQDSLDCKAGEPDLSSIIPAEDETHEKLDNNSILQWHLDLLFKERPETFVQIMVKHIISKFEEKLDLEFWVFHFNSEISFTVTEILDSIVSEYESRLNVLDQSPIEFIETVRKKIAVYFIVMGKVRDS